MTIPFTGFNLRPELQQALDEAGYLTCTPIQELTLPESLLGHDLMGVAKTGTGKTAAFLIPILQAIEPGGDPQALVICPTRELALQVGGEAEKLGRRLGVRSAVMYGGTSLGAQKQLLLGGVDLVVGTPGRLLDFMTSAYLPMRRFRWLVLDEADRMLDMGFIEEVDKILRRVPMSRQTMLFSATLPPPILELAHRYMLYPKEFRIDTGTKVPEGIVQVFYRCPHGRKIDMLRAILKTESPSKALIFTATKVSTSEIARRLRSDGHEVYPISSNLRQADRERVLDGFRQGTIRMLVATDVAARGIDIDDISHVINLELPTEPEDYVHRIGRTGRVDRSGRAISLVEPRDEPSLRLIERLLGGRFEAGVLPGFEPKAGDAAQEEHGGRRGGRSGGGARGGRGGSGGRSRGPRGSRRDESPVRAVSRGDGSAHTDSDGSAHARGGGGAHTDSDGSARARGDGSAHGGPDGRHRGRARGDSRNGSPGAGGAKVEWISGESAEHVPSHEAGRHTSGPRTQVISNAGAPPAGPRGDGARRRRRPRRRPGSGGAA